MRQLNKYQSSDRIPYSENAIEEFVKTELKQYQGKSFYCKALGVNVLIISKSIKETAYNCRISRQAANLALSLPYIIKNAKILELHLPIQSNTQKSFYFTEIATLMCNVKYKGIAKLTIGYRKNGKTLEYAITNFQRNNTSQFID